MGIIMANAKEWGLPVGTRPSLGDGSPCRVGMKKWGRAAECRCRK